MTATLTGPSTANTARRGTVPTIREVAKLARVDASTVSRVLRGDPKQVVRPETRARIFAAADQLRYRANSFARGLRTGRTDTVGLVVPRLDNIGFVGVTHGIYSGAAQRGLFVVVAESEVAGQTRPVYETAERYASMVLDGRVDGLLVAFATLDDRLVGYLAERNLPLVLVNRRTAGMHGSVVVDDEMGGRLAAEHLLSLGHNRIGLVGIPRDVDTGIRRETGLRETLASARVPLQERWVVHTPASEVGGYSALQALLESSLGDLPTALFVESLSSAVGVLAALRDAGIDVPHRMSVIAFNDHPIAAYLDPPLTTVKMPNFEMGLEAVRMLHDAVGGLPVSDLMIKVAPELVVRRSTAGAHD